MTTTTINSNPLDYEKKERNSRYAFINVFADKELEDWAKDRYAEQQEEEELRKKEKAQQDKIRIEKKRLSGNKCISPLAEAGPYRITNNVTREVFDVVKDIARFSKDYYKIYGYKNYTSMYTCLWSYLKNNGGSNEKKWTVQRIM